MNILDIEYHQIPLLLALEDVKLLNSELKPYENAHIVYRVDYPEKYLPCQNYVLKGQIDIIKAIDEYCKNKSYLPRINNLSGVLLITTSQGKFTFTPPIVEKDNFLNNEYIINDGMHRMYYFMNYTDDPVRMVIVEDAICPYYAYPTTWDKVRVLLDDFIPEDFVKKVHRINEYKKLYRDFNTVFQHPVGAPRGKGQMR